MSDVYAHLSNQRTVFQMVARTFPETTRTIKTVPEIFAFVHVSEVYADAGEAVNNLTLIVDSSEFADGATRNQYMWTLRSGLRACPNVADLTLILPKKTPDAVFFQVIFPILRRFKTNLPHQAIKNFLSRHPSLTDLVVGDCGILGRRQCPLADVDLGHINTLQCPAVCVRYLVHPGLIHLAVENKSTACFVPQVICTLPVMMPALHSLSLDIFTDDGEILDSIARVAPMVRKLKLVEKNASVRRSSLRRRAFNDYLTWYRALRKLVFLEEFALRTSAHLVRKPANYDAEHRVIMGWACGVRTRRNTFKLAKIHPSLYHIRVWYGVQTNSSVLTQWYNDAGEWFRLEHPTLGAQFEDLDF